MSATTSTSPVGSASEKASSFDTKLFRDALGQFATGVTVVTAADGLGGFVGTTASSFNSVSMNPPLILWSIDNGARSLPAYEQARHFVVNVLAADQVQVSNHFARQQEDKFGAVEFDLNQQSAPVLRGCSAWFHCETRYMYEGGDHTIIVGEVQQFESSGRDGLLFHQGRYSVSDAHPVVATHNEPKATGQESFAANYLHYLAGRCFHQLMNKLDQMLDSLDISQNEYRVLASFSGLQTTDRDTLLHYTLLTEETLQPVMSGLQEKGLLKPAGSGFGLSAAGQDLLVQLMAIAKSNEADMLGTFSQQQAQQFKQMLKQAIAWTA
jgi:flavin reductase (DIM6/NTAB) family NADH-FMN oxidoreductase RutF/DNA-binding MarR family transcriptional regulator